jgi:hypothetical protein
LVNSIKFLAWRLFPPRGTGTGQVLRCNITSALSYRTGTLTKLMPPRSKIEFIKLQTVEFFVDLCYSIKETCEGFIGLDNEKVVTGWANYIVPKRSKHE